MGTTARWVLIGGLAVLGFASSGQSASAQATAPAPERHTSRIRTDNPIIRVLIHEASVQSQTFRTLVAAIDATDGLVYVNAGTCGRLRACFLHQVTLAGPSRVLNILVDVRRVDLALAAPIAHELQHALEVLGDAGITSDRDIFAFYRLHGFEIRGVMETAAAIAAGDAVRAEVTR